MSRENLKIRDLLSVDLNVKEVKLCIIFNPSIVKFEERMPLKKTLQMLKERRTKEKRAIQDLKMFEKVKKIDVETYCPNSQKTQDFVDSVNDDKFKNTTGRVLLAHGEQSSGVGRHFVVTKTSTECKYEYSHAQRKHLQALAPDTIQPYTNREMTVYVQKQRASMTNIHT